MEQLGYGVELLVEFRLVAMAPPWPAARSKSLLRTAPRTDTVTEWECSKADVIERQLRVYFVEKLAAENVISELARPLGELPRLVPASSRCWRWPGQILRCSSRSSNQRSRIKRDCERQSPEILGADSPIRTRTICRPHRHLPAAVTLPDSRRAPLIGKGRCETTDGADAQMCQKAVREPTMASQYREGDERSAAKFGIRKHPQQ